MELAQHIVLRAADSRVLAPAPFERRQVARTVLRLAQKEELLAFALADTHLHLLVACPAPAGRQLARRIEISLARRFSIPGGFSPVYTRPVQDGRHLGRAFSYILEQCNHHGLEWDPLHEASNLPDLLGLRLLGSYTAAAVRGRLPRTRRADLLSFMGLADLQPTDLPVERLVWATLAATTLRSLQGNSAETVAARQALVHVVGPRLPALALAPLLSVSVRTIHAARARPADPRLTSAIRLQLGLMQHRAEALRNLTSPFIEQQTSGDQTPACSGPVAA